MLATHNLPSYPRCCYNFDAAPIPPPQKLKSKRSAIKTYIDIYTLTCLPVRFTFIFYLSDLSLCAYLKKNTSIASVVVTCMIMWTELIVKSTTRSIRWQCQAHVRQKFDVLPQRNNPVRLFVRVRARTSHHRVINNFDLAGRATSRIYGDKEWLPFPPQSTT